MKRKSTFQSSQYAILTPIQKRHVVHRVVYFCKYFSRCNIMFLLLVLQIEPMGIYLDHMSHMEAFYFIGTNTVQLLSDFLHA